MLSDLIYSVEDVWLFWLVNCAVLSVLIYRSLSSQNWYGIASFFRDERGASYALNYLMTFPFYLILVCWVIQGTMILIVKIGVMHSAHMAARSAIVWRPAHPYDDATGLQQAKEKARCAAALAITPYASGLKAHQNVFLFDPPAQARAIAAIPHAFAYDKLYRVYAEQSEAKNHLSQSAFIQRKFRYASAMTYVDLAQHTNQFNEELHVDVRFRMPIHIPGAGRLLGTLHPSQMGYYRDVRARATLPLETPESPDGRLGIDYDSSQL